MARVAALSLNAADRHQCLAANVDHIATEREREQSGFGKTELAGTDKDDLLIQTGGGKFTIHTADRLLERQRHMIRENQRCGAGPTFAPIDRDEIDTSSRCG